MFDGFVLRKPRVAGANSPFTSDPDTVVLPRDSDTSGTSDRDEYLAAFVNNPSATLREYLVVPSATANLVVGTSLITETPTQVDDAGLIYQFNIDGLAVKDVTVTPVPDTLDIRAGVFSYNTAPGPFPSVTYREETLSVYYVKNDNVTRFGFDDRKNRWTPRPGGTPDLLETVPTDSTTALAMVEADEDAGTPRIAIGSPSATPIPVTWIATETLWDQYKDGTLTATVGEAVAFAQEGELIFAPDVISSSAGRAVYQFRRNFFSFDASSGFVGIAGDGAIFLNPIPGPDDLPLIRSKYTTYLDVAKTTDPVGSEEVRWDPATGEVTFTSSTFDGTRIYYDGVYNVQDPVPAYPPTDLGTLTPNFLATTGISTIDANEYDVDALILFVVETGKAIETIEFVESPDDFPAPYKIPDTKAFAYHDTVAGTVELQLSNAFVQANAGNTLAVGTGDFYLEDGITFRMFRSVLDPRNDNEVPDARARIRVVDEVMIDGISAGPFSRVSQIPLQDIAGYSEDVYYRILKGAARRILTPEEGIVYDFDANQIRWASRENESVSVLQQTSDVDLPDQVLYDRNFEFRLDEGNGFETLVSGQDVLIDFDTGRISLADAYGRELYSGTGNAAGSTFSVTDDTSFDFLSDIGEEPSNLDTLLQPLLVLDSGEVYRIEDYTSTTLTTHLPIETDGDGISFVVIEAPEIVYEAGLQDLTLNRRWIFPELIVSLDTGASPLYVPSGESYEFLVDGANAAHVTLSTEELGQLADEDGNPNTLFVPGYYLASESVFSIFRDSKELTEVVGAPSEGEFSYDSGTGELTFASADITAYPAAAITLEPSLSVGRTTGPVEVLAEDRSVGLPSDIVGTTLEAMVLLREDQYTVQAAGGIVFFNDQMITGTRLRVRYYTDADTEVIEDVGFQVRETLSPTPTQTSSDFASGIDIDTQRPTTVLLNGAPYGDASVDLGNKKVSYPPIKSGRVLQVNYFALAAQGGEQVVQLLQIPFTPPVSVLAGTPDQSFYGNHVSVLPADTMLIFDDVAYMVTASSYDSGSDTTSVSLLPTPTEEVEGPTIVQGTTIPLDRRSTLPLAMDRNSKDEREIRFYGDVTTSLPTSHGLFLDGAPYLIVSVVFDDAENVTRVTTQTKLLREYVNPSITLTEEPVYPPNPQVLFADNLLYGGETTRLIRFNTDGTGELLTRGESYEVLDDGSIALDPTISDLPDPGEIWMFGYLGRKFVGPRTFGARVLIPRLEASYTRYIAATEENGISGAKLQATYSFDSPDSFYFRAVPLEEYANEVAIQLATDAVSASPATGPSTSFSSGSELYDKGGLSLIGEGGDFLDKDRVARRFLRLYNETSQLFESYLQTIDGRVVGDRSGQFKFFLADDETPGGDDPVTGVLIDYYANPDGSGTRHTEPQIRDINVFAQEGFIRNSIDDIIVTSKKPFRFYFQLPSFQLEFLGTFKRAWEPHRLSRLYPQRSNVATITPPDTDNDGEYEFFQDFGKVLGDLGEDDIMSIANLQDRPPRAWVTDPATSAGGSSITIPLGMVFNLGDGVASNPGDGANSLPNLDRGDADRKIPGFEPDQVVSLGRVTYVKDPVTGLVERQVSVYAENMIVETVSTDSVTVKAMDDGFVDSLIPGAVLGDFNLTATDPSTIVDQVERHDTLFGQPQAFLRQGFDFGLDASEGELTNLKLPDLFATLSGQNSPEPFTYLDAQIVYKNQLTEPKRFPALDGEPVDDDGLIGIPYGYPISDSESTQILTEREAHELVLGSSYPGFVGEATVLDGHTLRFSIALDDPGNLLVPPRLYDLLLAEGDTAGGTPETGGSTARNVAEVSGTDLFVAAFNVQEAGFGYTILQGIGGTGTSAGTTWTDDASRDFTGLAGLAGVLQIGTSFYTITSFNNGSVTVSVPIAEPSGSFTIDLTGTGNIVDLYRVDDPGFDFSLVDQGSLIIGSGPNAGTYPMDSGTVDAFFPHALDPGIPATEHIAVSLGGSEIVGGTGQRNAGDNTIWDDVGIDFTVFTGSPAYLHVLTKNGASEVTSVASYEVTSLNPDFVQVADPIATGVVSEYYLITKELSSIGSASVDLAQANRKLWLRTDFSTQPVAVNDTLVIESSANVNGGRYKVVAIDLADAPYPSITVDRDFYATSGDVSDANPVNHVFPVRFRTYRPRRFSDELAVLQDALLQKRVLYDEIANAPTSPIDIQDLLTTGGYTAANPSAPSLPLLRDLVEEVFGIPDIEASDGAIVDLGGGDFSLDSPSSDFSGTDDPEAYILIEDGDSRGFYRVATVLTATSVQLRDGTEFGTDFLSGLASDSGITFKLWQVERFAERTYELVLYEFINLLEILRRLDSGIITSTHDPDNFTSTSELEEFPGDPEDETLNFHITGSYTALPVGIQDRDDWVNGTAPNLVQEIEAVLSGTENLYDLRFSWIDFRTNLETGTLPGYRRFRNELAKRKRKRLRELLRVSSSQT